jgi:SAM-dependent methyltransferase
VPLANNVAEQRAYYARGARKTMLPGATPYVLRQIDEVVRVGQLRSGERVLDVGCGMGRHAFLLAERGLEIEGLELSPQLLDRMRDFDNGRYNISTYCADMSAPPPELVGRFDALVGFFVLHHVRHLEAAFAGLAPLLRPGGRAIFLEPNPANALYYLQILLTPGMTWSAEKGMLNMRPRRLFGAMRAAGLEASQMHRFGFFPPLLRNRRWGGPAEAWFERIELLEPVLPFQIFRADRPDGVFERAEQ